MKPLRRFWNRLRGTFIGARMDDDLAAEIESHLRMQMEDNMRAGMSAHEARRGGAEVRWSRLLTAYGAGRRRCAA